MKVIPSALLADLQKDSTSLAFLWTIEMANGRMIRGTEHDRDIVIATTDSGVSPPDKYEGTYYAIANVTAGDIASTSDLTVDNLQVDGAFAQAPYTAIPDISVDDIESGLLDMAPVTVLICNWRSPAHGYFIIKGGYLGAITRDSDGKYVTEVRGLTQLLAQTIIRSYSSTCNVVKFGDNRCRYNVAAITVTGAVLVETNRQLFSVDLAQPSPAWPYVGGTLTFTSGANQGFAREVKVDPNTNDGFASFWEPFPEAIAPGDAFTLSPGCDRLSQTCQLYGNLVHWRGPGIFIPGLLALTAGPTTAQEML